MPILHTVAVKSTNPGGRLYCGKSEQVRKNGEFGFLGEYVDGSHQIRTFAAPTVVTAANLGRMPVVIMQPEMMYDDVRMSDKKLANWDIPANTAFCCVPLEEGDKFEITADALNLRGQDAITSLELGKCYELANGSTQLTLTTQGNGDTPATDKTVYFEIVKIKDCHKRHARIAGDTVSGNYELYTMEVKVKRA